MDKPRRKPWPKSKTSDISKQSPSPLHHTFLLGRTRFTAQPLSTLLSNACHAGYVQYSPQIDTNETPLARLDLSQSAKNWYKISQHSITGTFLSQPFVFACAFQ